MPKSYCGWLLLDKPIGISSAQVLNPIKLFFKKMVSVVGKIKVGHAGTLDPFASGLLMVAIGKATKTVEFAMAQSKIYEFTITWGERRDSEDRDGKLLETSEIRPTSENIAEVLSEFMGDIMQIPPQISAKKLGGVRAYKIARSGAEAALVAQPVKVTDLNLLWHDGQDSKFQICCSKGFYIRALARDIAIKLGALGYVSSLRRTHIGKFCISNAITLANIEKILHNSIDGELQSLLIPIAAVLDDILVLQCNEAQMQDLLHGRAIPVSDDCTNGENSIVCVRHKNIDIALCRMTGLWLQPTKLLID